MDDYELLIDLHRHGHRQGPGGDAETLLAMSLAGIDRDQPLKMSDIGCGTGASTVLLAQRSRARITAVDLLPDFLEVLDERARRADVGDRISTLACSMDALPFADGELDVLWSEGAIYSMGFEKAVSSWRRHLKSGGLLVASEITWLTESRPPELESHWNREYPEIDVASAKLGVLEKHGYAPVGYFVLPEHCWLDQYYRPMQERFADFLTRNGNSEAAREIVEAERREIRLYESHRAYYSYGMYIAQKL
ncbi:MAG: class I SAM-dependent methyltransferase [Acidobacteriota bacterium]